MSSLYAKYMAERSDVDVFEMDEGFATYKIENDYVYIIDIYVLPEHRYKGVAKEMADAIAHIANIEGISRMLGSVDPLANGATESMKVLLAYGMSVCGFGNGGKLIMFEKFI